MMGMHNTSIFVWIVISLSLLHFAKLQVNVATVPRTLVPILSQQPGWVYDSRPLTAKVKVEIFLEVLCYGSRRAWNIIKPVINNYQSDHVVLVIHQFPLPYHRYGFIASQSVLMVRQLKPNKVVDYMEAVFRDLERFTDANSANITATQVIRQLAGHAERVAQMDPQVFTQNLSDYRSATREAWKYATRRGVSGVPWFFVNGIELSLQSPGMSDWLAILDPLVGVAQSRSVGDFQKNVACEYMKPPQWGQRNHARWHSTRFIWFLNAVCIWINFCLILV